MIFLFAIIGHGGRRSAWLSNAPVVMEHGNNNP